MDNQRRTFDIGTLDKCASGGIELIQAIIIAIVRQKRVIMM
jgi:hypothetical protein